MKYSNRPHGSFEVTVQLRMGVGGRLQRVSLWKLETLSSDVLTVSNCREQRDLESLGSGKP